MKIVVDQNIPLGLDAFADAGDVIELAGRSIQTSDLVDCQALIVRSITKVNRELLEGTPVKFVGTCTIGTDHLDKTWLESNGIEWASAPGCNARSVAEWVGAVLAWAHLERRIDLSASPRAGIVGVGRVGTQVAQVLSCLVGEILLNDPPRAEAEGEDGFHELSDLVRSCQIVSAHLPLTRTDDHATHRLLTHRILSQLPPNAMFINAGRGPTAVSRDLLALARGRADLTLALDVFDPEPTIPADLARAAHLISPHVAGYSLEGKQEGTRMIREAFGRHLGLPVWDLPPVAGIPLSVANLRVEDSAVHSETDPWDALCALILAAWNPIEDDTQLRSTMDLPELERGANFDRLRKEYPVRLEWRHRPVIGAEQLPPETWERALRLGFVAG